MAKIQRALLSVSDKTGIVDFAKSLSDCGIELVSTGGTAALLTENGIDVKQVEEITAFPEMMDGRVKTLHPKIHGGLLGLRDNETHAAQARQHGIEWIDMVVVNLYPFEATVARENVSLEEVVENIDIGGPAIIRSAAKNYQYVAVITDPEDYDTIAREIADRGEVCLETRKRLAVKAFKRTADYDSVIDTYFSKTFLDEKVLRLKFEEGQNLRYGENSHQSAVFYKHEKCQEVSVASAEILHGKEMSFNNYVDGDAAFEAVKDLSGQIGVAVIKHTNPCGYATGETVREALERAWAGDPISAFGSVIACNAPVDLAFAEFLKGKNIKHIGYVIENGKLVPGEVPTKFVEVIIAPGFSRDALDLLSSTKTLRLLQTKALNHFGIERKTYRKITGGILEMDRDLQLKKMFDIKTKKGFEEHMIRLADFAFKACKHTKSNAIVLAREYYLGYFQVIGMGAGQPNRVDSLRKLAVTKALENLQIEYDQTKPALSFDAYVKKAFSRIVLASDAFFPFDDTVRAAQEAGIRYIVQPGGSKRDGDSIAVCDKNDMAMAFTGMRHFRH